MQTSLTVRNGQSVCCGGQKTLQQSIDTQEDKQAHTHLNFCLEGIIFRSYLQVGGTVLYLFT